MAGPVGMISDSSTCSVLVLPSVGWRVRSFDRRRGRRSLPVVVAPPVEMMAGDDNARVSVSSRLVVQPIFHRADVNHPRATRRHRLDVASSILPDRHLAHCL